MAADLSQDAVLRFLQSNGGSVKNADLLLHFRYFIRDHADRDRNREMFKKFVNTVASVRQTDGVSYVVLRKQFKGNVPRGGAGGSSAPPWVPAGPHSANLTPGVSADKSLLKPQLGGAGTPAPPGHTAGKTVMPVAGIVVNNNNNNMETNLNLKRHQQLKNTPQESDRRVAAQGTSLITEKTELKAPSQQQKVSFGPFPGVTPVVGHHGETSQQVPVPPALQGTEACLQPEGGLHQDPPLHPEVTPRRVRYRSSYKSAVSCDEDEEEEEEVSVRQSSGDAVWPLSIPMSTSSPCIMDRSASPVISSSSSSLSERKIPKICIQDMERELLAPLGQGRSFESGLEPVSLSGELMCLEPEGYTPSPDPRPQRSGHQDPRYSQPAGAQLEATQGRHQNQKELLSSSHSSVFSPLSDAGFSSSDWPPYDSSRGSRWNSSFEDLQARTGETGHGVKIQEVLQRAERTELEAVTRLANSKTTASPWYHSTGNLYDDQEPTLGLSPFHHSTGNLDDDQEPMAQRRLVHLSTGDFDEHERVDSSEGSTSSPMLRPAVTGRLSSQLRSRMCCSLGADLDQILQEEGRGVGGGGSDAARLNRLHLISSSLSLRANLSSSSLSSCSTPPRCHSLAELVEGTEHKGGRKSLPAAVSSSSSTAHHEGPGRQSLLPLEPREHAWLVKGAAGAWPDIYSLFRQDSSLLNKQDFISGFTVLHWIAKHGDHRVLNTLWYGVEKAGLTFNINARSTCGHTPLHIAAMHGNKNIIRLLVKNFNADVKQRDIAGKRPWQYLGSTAPPDIFQLLGAPVRAALGGVGTVDTSWDQQQRNRRRHHLSSASSGVRPLTILGMTKVKRSTSLAAFLKPKSLHSRLGQQVDNSV